MKTKLCKYNPETDFIRVRDFLVETFSLSQKPLNWGFERWNYARFFVLPMLVTEGVGKPNYEAVDAAVQLWNKITGIWENETGEIVGVANIEHADKTHPGWGEAFIQRHPDYDVNLPEILDYAETYLRSDEKNKIAIPIYDYDRDLIAAVQARNYSKNEKYTLWDAVFTVEGEVPETTLPDGYHLRSMADEGSDIDKRRKVFGVGFNHPDPKDWPSRLSYLELQRAPDYRLDLDIYVVAPDGEYVACCIGWWDATNQMASLEPVATDPAFRRKGLARAAVYEAIRRTANLGAKRVFVGSDQDFYLSLGFELTYPTHHWVKQF